MTAEVWTSRDRYMGGTINQLNRAELCVILVAFPNYLAS